MQNFFQKKKKNREKTWVLVFFLVGVLCVFIPHSMEENRRVFSSKQNLSEALVAHVKKIAEESIASRGKFRVAISGGSLPSFLSFFSSPSSSSSSSSSLSLWQIFLVDERCVAHDHPDSNYGAIRAVFPKETFIFPMVDEKSLRTPRDSAEEYEKLLKKLDALPLDLVLLGLGEDGHTASLFPGHALLRMEESRIVYFLEDSPKPPPARVTLTMQTLLQARHLAFVATGAGKQDPVSAIFKDKNTSLPAAMVQSKRPDTIWFLDNAACAKL